MDKISILEQIRSSDNLMSLPQALSEILTEIGKEDFSADSLANIILKDPSLTGQVLRMANSSFYKRFSNIKTVHQAVSVLGATTVKCLALSSSILNPDKIEASTGVDPKAYFSYLLSVASASEKIASAISYKAPEEAFIAGLLHDVGILFFLHHHAEDYTKVIRKEDKKNTLIEAEKKVFGIDHGEVGHHLTKMWGLPDYVVDSIESHHNYYKPENNGNFQNIISLATLLSHDRFSGYEMELEERLKHIEELSNILSLTKDQVDEISSLMLVGTLGAAEYLRVDIGNIEEILIKANKEIWKSYLTIENLFKERQELSESLLREEHSRGAIESKNIAMATLSHYLNNAIMAIYGRSQILRMMLGKGDTDQLPEILPVNLDVIDKSIEKIVAVLEEMKNISPIDDNQFYDMSKTLNIDDKIEKRLAVMSREGKFTGEVEVTPELAK